MAKQKRYNGYLRKCFTYEGKKYTIYGKTNDELMEKVVNKKRELEQGAESLFNPTLFDYYKTYCEIRHKQIKESTYRTQTIYFKNVANVELAKGVILGNMRIKEITRRDIELARNKILKSGKNADTINNYFTYLSQVFKQAVMDEIINKNPCKALRKIKRQSKTINETIHRALTIEETKKFFEEANVKPSYYLNIFSLMVLTGLRLGEATALYYTDIDLKEGYIHVRRTITRSETGGLCVGKTTKTKGSVRDIPLNEKIIDIIQRQKQQNRTFFGLENEGLLFKSINKGGIIKESVLNYEIDKICKATGIERFTCHAFRNTFATRFIEQRPQDYKILSELLGHTDIGITLNLYTHVMNENRINAMKDIQIKIS